MAKKVIAPGGSVSGLVELPGDKSISHRYAILAALAEGTSEIVNYASAADCRSTLECLRELGVRMQIGKNTVSDRRSRAARTESSTPRARC
jgi:3-phosphoshikimate 1-carboxyvinyltransferase